MSKKCYWCGFKIKKKMKFCCNCGKDNSISDKKKKEIFNIYLSTM